MVKTTKKESRSFYQCEECGFWYKEQELAEKCEEWCRKHQSCNLEITKFAVKLPK